MFGYAADDTPDLMPATLYYSHKILERMAADRHSGAGALSLSRTPRAR
jgi:S-adenosylmethionine synthetase